MKTTYDLIMFDLDGTLIETAPEICDAVNDTLWRFKLPAVTQDRVDGWIGHGTYELLIQAIAFVNDIDSATVRSSDSIALIAQEFNKNYHERCGTRSHLYPHVQSTIDTLLAAGIKLAVVTNKEAQYTQRVLEAHNLSSTFHRVISGDTLDTKKPRPDGINNCLTAFGVPKDKALFVGDSSIDVATARNAGVTVWALPYGYNMGEPIEKCSPDRVIPDFRSLIQGIAH